MGLNEKIIHPDLCQWGHFLMKYLSSEPSCQTQLFNYITFDGSVSKTDCTVLLRCKLYIWLMHLTYSCIRRQSCYLWKIPIRRYFSAEHLLMRKFVTMDSTLLWRDVIKGNIFIGMFFDSLSLYTFKLSWLCFINPYKTALGWCHQFYRVRFTTLITCNSCLRTLILK